MDINYTFTQRAILVEFLKEDGINIATSDDFKDFPLFSYENDKIKPLKTYAINSSNSSLLKFKNASFKKLRINKHLNSKIKTNDLSDQSQKNICAGSENSSKQCSTLDSNSLTTFNNEVNIEANINLTLNCVYELIEE